MERKVTAAGTGAGLGAALGQVLVWALQRYVWPDGVPEQVSTLVTMLTATAVAVAAGWLARHTPRPDLPMLDR
jgi:hypothetical protein